MKSLYDKTLQQITFLDDRFYTFDNVNFYPSVTTILDVYPKGFGYSQWLKDVGSNAEEVSRRAMDLGSLIHDTIDRLLSGEEIVWEEGKFDLDAWLMLNRFMEFWNMYKPEVISHEVSLCSPKLGFGGTIDLVCRIANQIWLIDYKTGNAIYKPYEFQISAYTEMWNEKTPELKIERSGILHLKAQTRGPDAKKKKIQGEGWILREFERKQEDAFRIFDHVHKLWLEENPEVKPKNRIYPAVLKLDMEGEK